MEFWAYEKKKKNKDFLARPSVPSLIRQKCLSGEQLICPRAPIKSSTSRRSATFWLFIGFSFRVERWAAGLGSPFILFTWCVCAVGGGDIVSVVLICCADWARSLPPSVCCIIQQIFQSSKRCVLGSIFFFRVCFGVADVSSFLRNNFEIFPIRVCV